MPRRVLTAFLLACGMAALAAQTPPPVFRAGVDVVQVDVTVLDKDRKPVRGLTAADFTVYEDGKPRPIVTFTPVDLPPPRPMLPALDAAPWTRDVAPDVATNAVPQEGRLVVILFDWSIRFEDQQTARKIATAAVNQLGPGDEAAVIFSSGFANAGTPQGFTSDRARLLEAINRPIAPAMQNPSVGPAHDIRNLNDVMLDDPEGYESGDCHCRLCVLDAVAHIADLVRDVPGRRKVLLFVGTFFQGYEATYPVPGTTSGAVGFSPFLGSTLIGPTSTPPPGSGVCAGELNVAREKMQRATGLANLTVDVVDPVGLGTTGADPLGGNSQLMQRRQDDLHIMPDMTGGRTVLNTNAPEELVPAIFQESQSYYLLAVERGTQANDGKLHNLEVKVNRPGVSVRYRNGYYATDALAAAQAPPSSMPLTTTLDRVLPLSDLPLSVTAEPFATPGASQPAAIGLVIGVHEPSSPQAPAGQKETETVLAAMFDTKGQSLSSARQTINVSPSGGAGKDARYEVVSRLGAEPGRYEVRVAVDIAPDRRGSVNTFVDVPDFAKAALSLSGFAVGATPPSPVASPDILKDLLPIVPTARREFAPADRVTSFLRIYQGGSGAPAPVSLVSRIVDVRGISKFDETLAMGADKFSTNRAADYQLQLPLARLDPGEYLLTVKAQHGSASAERALRFTVTPAPVPARATMASSSPKAATSAPAARSAALDSVLTSVGAYLDRYVQDMAAITCEERYVQRLDPLPMPDDGTWRRTLRSDMFVQTDEQLGWVMFRDTFQVNGSDVRDRDDRLAKILASPSAAAWQRARAIADESARFNLNLPLVTVGRTANVPMTALLFLRAQEQHRSQFKIEGQETVNGHRATVVSFPGGGDAEARAPRPLETATGRVLRTELSYTTNPDLAYFTRVMIRVSYAEPPKLGLLAPASMDERYEAYSSRSHSPAGGIPTVAGQATYTNYHRFNVDTTETARQK